MTTQSIMTCVLIKRRNPDTDVPIGRMPHEHEGRDGAGYIYSQGTPKVSANHQKLGESCETDPSSLPSGETNPCKTLISDSEPPEPYVVESAPFVVLCYDNCSKHKNPTVFLRPLNCPMVPTLWYHTQMCYHNV